MSVAAPPGRRTQPAPGNSGRFYWTVDTFYRAIAAGVFDEPNRLELINGELWDRQVMNPPHAATARRIGRRLRNALEPGLLVMEEKPFHIADDGEPRPDVCAVRGTEEDFEYRHPTAEKVRLVVEVADSSTDRDTGEKALLYARAGIRDYWVSLVNARELWIYRNPTPNGYDGDPQHLRDGDTVSPLFAPDVTIPVTDLLSPRPAGNAA